MTRTQATNEAPTMTTTTPAPYTIAHDPENAMWLVLDADGEVIDDGATEKAARKVMAKRVAEERHEELMGEITEKMWDADLAVLEKIRALLGK